MKYLGPTARAQARRETKKPEKPRRIAKRTPQKARLQRQYVARVRVWIVGLVCLGCQVRKFDAFKAATECHHRNGRAGLLLMDERFWLPMCGSCHRFTHSNPDEARRLGLLCAVGEWNKVPKA